MSIENISQETYTINILKFSGTPFYSINGNVPLNYNKSYQGLPKDIKDKIHKSKRLVLDPHEFFEDKSQYRNDLYEELTTQELQEIKKSINEEYPNIPINIQEHN